MQRQSTCLMQTNHTAKYLGYSKLCVIPGKSTLYTAAMSAVRDKTITSDSSPYVRCLLKHRSRSKNMKHSKALFVFCKESAKSPPSYNYYFAHILLIKAINGNIRMSIHLRAMNQLREKDVPWYHTFPGDTVICYQWHSQKQDKHSPQESHSSAQFNKNARKTYTINQHFGFFSFGFKKQHCFIQ